MSKSVPAFAFAVIGIYVLTATSVTAQVTNISLGNLQAPAGFEILIDFDGQYTGSQLIMNLTRGSILNPDFLTLPLADNPLDTFFALGVPSPANGIPGISAAVDLGGGNTSFVNETTIEAGWFAPAGVVLADQEDFLSARIALTPDAKGTFTYLASANGEIIVTEGTFVNGGSLFFYDDHIPEPTTAGLLGLAGLSLLARRRKTA